MFIAYYSQIAIAPKIMNDLGYGNIGFINVATIHMAFTIGSLFASIINRTLGHKFTFFVASVMYALWAFAFMLPGYKHENKNDPSKISNGIFSDASIISISLITAALVGFVSGPLWITQGCYISECASVLNRGRFNVIFFGFFQLATIVAPLVTSLLIAQISKFTFYFTMGVIGLCGSISFLFLRKPIEIEDGMMS